MIEWHKISCHIKYEQITCYGNSQEGYLKLNFKYNSSLQSFCWGLFPLSLSAWACLISSGVHASSELVRQSRPPRQYERRCREPVIPHQRTVKWEMVAVGETNLCIFMKIQSRSGPSSPLHFTHPGLCLAANWERLCSEASVT